MRDPLCPRTAFHDMDDEQRDVLGTRATPSDCPVCNALHQARSETGDRVVRLETSIEKWHQEKYGHPVELGPTLRHLGEEIGEFMQAVVEAGPGLSKMLNDHVVEEAADVVLILTNLIRGFYRRSLFTAMEAKHEVCKQRLAKGKRE